MATKVDTVIVGAGSAGLSALREVRRRTADFLLINDGHWGTVTGAVDFARQGRARIAAANAGLMRLYADPADARLLGAEMCAPAAEHMAHLLALAVEQRLTVPQILAMPFYHPVLEEGLRSALRDLARRLPDAGGSDLSACGEIGHEALD